MMILKSIGTVLLLVIIVAISVQLELPVVSILNTKNTTTISQLTATTNRSSSDYWNDSSLFYYAPLIVGGGQGTTGTHLFLDATCALGLPSLHFMLGCIPKQAIAVKDDSICPVPLTFNDNYSVLIKYHMQLTRRMLAPLKKQDFESYRDGILNTLEKIIIWGKYNKVGLALHDSPYPLLMPEILRLVRKHYGDYARPIILTSERDPEDWAERRTKMHGSHSYICKNTTLPKMNSKTLKGGASDFVGCIDIAISSSSDDISEVMYSLKEANRLGEQQYIIDMMEDYQNALRDHSLFTYNAFEKENRTRTSDLAMMMKQTMQKAKEDGSIWLSDFVGFEDLFSDEQNATFRNNNTDTAENEVLSKHTRSNNIADVHLTRKILLTNLSGKRIKGKANCPK